MAPSYHVMANTWQTVSPLLLDTSSQQSVAAAAAATANIHAVQRMHGHTKNCASQKCPPESKGGVTAAVVKFNALSNSVRAATQDENLGLVCRLCLALAIVRAVHVRRGSLKLGCTCVYTLVGGLKLQLLALCSHCLLLDACGRTGAKSLHEDSLGGGGRAPRGYPSVQCTERSHDHCSRKSAQWLHADSLWKEWCTIRSARGNLNGCLLALSASSSAQKTYKHSAVCHTA